MFTGALEPSKSWGGQALTGICRRGGGWSSQKHFPDITKKFSGYITFFPKYENFFPVIPKNFQDI